MIAICPTTFLKLESIRSILKLCPLVCIPALFTLMTDPSCPSAFQIHVPVPDRRHTNGLCKQCTEVIGIIVSHHSGNLGRREIGRDQHCLGKADPPADNIIDGSHTRGFFRPWET